MANLRKYHADKHRNCRHDDSEQQSAALFRCSSHRSKMSAPGAALFVRHGRPMRFYIAPTNAERVALAPLISENGGILLKSWSHGE
jgi:hypothetical protein